MSDAHVTGGALHGAAAEPRPTAWVLYEREPADPRPFGSAYVRLVQPLSHPAAGVDVTFATEAPERPVDVVVFDRLWHAAVEPACAADAVVAAQEVSRAVVYAVDDNLLDVDPRTTGLPDHAGAVSEAFARSADLVVVTTHALAERYGAVNPAVAVLPNALDERLLTRRGPPDAVGPFGPRRPVVGYMGTRTHDADLALVVPALEEVLARHGDVRFEILGGTRDPSPWNQLAPRVRILTPGSPEYPWFMSWWSSSVLWDIALGPLTEGPFNACKSDLKVLDYAAIGAAGVFSAVAPYDAAVEDGVNGLLVANDTAAWVAAVERLLCDAPLRRTLARAALDRLWSTRVLDRRAHEWGELLAETVAAVQAAA